MKNGNKLTNTSLEMSSVVTTAPEVRCKSCPMRQWYRSLVFEVMKTIQILVCLAYCLFFVMAIISKKQWLEAYRNHIRLQVYGLTIHWYESSLYFLISGIGLVGAVGEVLCCCIFYSVAHMIALPYCLVPWTLTVGIYRGWGCTQTYTKVCTNFRQLIVG